MFISQKSNKGLLGAARSVLGAGTTEIMMKCADDPGPQDSGPHGGAHQCHDPKCPFPWAFTEALQDCSTNTFDTVEKFIYEGNGFIISWGRKEGSLFSGENRRGHCIALIDQRERFSGKPLPVFPSSMGVLFLAKE